MYLEWTTGFWFEGNTFIYPGIVNEAGLIVCNSGSAYNQVYRNTFNSTRFGVVAYDANRGLNGSSGLKIECNNFTQNNRGIIVFPTTTAPPSGWGISHTQGMPAQGIDDPLPAGNYFTTTTNSVQNNLDFVTYYRHASEMVPPVIGGVVFVNLPGQNDCPSSFGGGLYEKELMATSHKNVADSVENVLSIIIDDGNTEALTDEVIYADYAAAVELYYDLMQVSPNLSEEVMIEAIKKEYELPASLLTLILSSNPHAAKSEKLQRELDERMQPLAEYQLDMINQGLDLVSYKEGLEARESYHRTKYSALIDQLAIEAFEDTTGIHLIDEIEAIIVGYETPEYAYLLADLYVRAGNMPAAQNQLNLIAENFELDTRKEAEYLDYQVVYGILMALATSSDTVSTIAQTDMLEEIAFKHSTRAAGLAAVTLSQCADFLLLETLVEPIDATPKSNRRPIKGGPEIKLCKVYPNPTAGILIIEVPFGFQNVALRITDVNGRLVFESRIIEGLNTINLREVSTGPYQLTIRSKDGILSESHNIQLIK